MPRPPDAVGMNRKLRKPIGFDETGFQGTGDRVYRRQAWEFLMAGGAVFSNLDYSFTPEHEDGSAGVEDPTPGGGGRELRRQLGILKDFLGRFDLVNASENNALVATTVPDGLRGDQGLSDRAGAPGLYVPRGPRVELGLDLPPGPITSSGSIRGTARSQGRRPRRTRAGPRAWSSALPTTLRTLPCGSRRVLRTNDDRLRTFPVGNSVCLASEVVVFP